MSRGCEETEQRDPCTGEGKSLIHSSCYNELVLVSVTVIKFLWRPEQKMQESGRHQKW